jgi:hypothetical protein
LAVAAIAAMTSPTSTAGPATAGGNACDNEDAGADDRAEANRDRIHQTKIATERGFRG